MRRVRGTVALVIAVTTASLVAACGPSGPSGPRATYPPVGATTPPVSAAVAQTRGLLEAGLRAAGFGLIDATQAYRPAEGPRLAGAGRAVFEAILAADPGRGRIVVYELTTTGDAAVAADDQAAYVASGVGRVQFPSGSRFVLTVVGSTVVFFTWTPEGAADPSELGRLAAAVGSVGTAVAVPG